MDFDFLQLPPALCYKLMVGLVVPRPIALVSTLNQQGGCNAAPFSFFNLMGDDPPILIVSVETKPSGALKDTASNILLQQEFVVNLVTEEIAQRMHNCANDFPPDVSEPAQVGFTLEAIQHVRTPRVVEAPVSLACQLYKDIKIAASRHLFIGRVVSLHCHDGVVDPQSFRVNTDRYFPIGRLYADRYTKTREQFSLDSTPEYLESLRKLGRL